MKKIIFFLTAIIIIATQVLAQPTPQDTSDIVWLKKTDQSDGFYMVKFSKNDSLIVGHGYQMDLFFDTKTGNEIKRIDGNSEVFFINNDRNFVRLSKDGMRFEIFDAKTYQVIDSLASDGNLIYPITGISNDERYLASVQAGCIKVWDIVSKQIIKQKTFPPEANLKKLTIYEINFSCDNTKLIVALSKEYNSYPNTYTVYYMPIFDFNTLDSIGAYKNYADFQFSKTCKYIAFKTFDKTYGVEVYDFNTKLLKCKIPVNGPSLTGLEFSPDDKYLVTTNGSGQAELNIWDMNSFKKVYNFNETTFENIDISYNGEKIISSIENELILLNFNIKLNKTDGNGILKNSVIYPNPASGTAIVKFNQPTSEQTQITLYDISGKQIKQLFNENLILGEQNINVNTEDITNGTYIIKVQSNHILLTFKLIINR